MREKLLRVLILFLGLTIAHLGVSLFLLADLGSDPFNVMIQGLTRTAGTLLADCAFTHGTMHVTVSVLIIVILLFADRRYIKIGTVICMFCGGPIIDFFNVLLGSLLTPESSMAVRIAGNVIGCAILACGMSVVIKSDAGTGPNDLVGVVISDKTGRRFSVVRMLVDGCFLAVGWLLGGAVGLGTLICLLLVGPVAGFFLPKSEALVNNIVALVHSPKS